MKKTLSSFNSLYYRICVVIICICAVTACRHDASVVTRYENAEYGISFEPPPGWHETTPSFSEGTFCQYEPPTGTAALYAGVFTDPIALFGNIQNTYTSFEHFLGDVYPNFVTVTSAVTTVSGLDAMRFTGVINNELIEGVCVRKQADEYFILMNLGNNHSANRTLLDNVISGVEITGTQTGHAQAKQALALIKPLEPKDKAREFLKSGQQLLYSRDVDIKNYDRAITKFLTVLVTLQDEDPRPPEYQQAIAALMIARSFRKTKLQELRVALEKAIALRDRSAAMRAADDIMKLYPNQKSRPYNYALKRWNKARALPVAE